MVKPFLEGLTLSEAIDKRRLFIIDLEILEGINSLEGYIVSLSLSLSLSNSLSLSLSLSLFEHIDQIFS